MTILVTGGGGFLGKAIVTQLRAKNEKVRSIARGDYPALREMGVEVLRGDLAEPARAREAVKGCSAVIHVAARAGQWGSYEDYYRPNVIATENVIAACRAEGVTRLVFTSSPSVIDRGEAIEGLSEADLSYPAEDEYVSPYSKTKGIAEQMILAANDANLSTVAIRPPLIWGPGDTQFIPRFQARNGRIPQIGNGQSLVDTTYIDNAAQAHLLAHYRLSPDSLIAGKAYFISNDDPRPIAEMLNHLLEAAGYSPMKIKLPIRLAYAGAGFVETVFNVLNIEKEPPATRFLIEQLSKARWFDISAAKQDLGYQAKISIETGIQCLKAHLAQ